MSLRIAFDLDGVFADLVGILDRRARSLTRAGRLRRQTNILRFVPRIPARQEHETDSPARLWPSLDARQRDQVWNSLARRPRLWEHLRELEPGSVARLGRLASERGWDVVFFTSRPAVVDGMTVQIQTQRWLAAHGFAMPSVIVCTGSRGPLAKVLRRDVVVDDRSRNCLDVATESPARAVLVWRDRCASPPAALAAFGVHTVTTVSACLDYLALTATECV